MVAPYTQSSHSNSFVSDNLNSISYSGTTSMFHLRGGGRYVHRAATIPFSSSRHRTHPAICRVGAPPRVAEPTADTRVSKSNCPPKRSPESQRRRKLRVVLLRSRRRFHRAQRRRLVRLYSSQVVVESASVPNWQIAETVAGHETQPDLHCLPEQPHFELCTKRVFDLELHQSAVARGPMSTSQVNARNYYRSRALLHVQESRGAFPFADFYRSLAGVQRTTAEAAPCMPTSSYYLHQFRSCSLGHRLHNDATV